MGEAEETRRLPENSPPRISIVIPAYNEEKRLTPTIEKTLAYFAGRSEKYEMIIVDDGSTDGTARLACDLSMRHPHIRVITVEPNQGKGNAVRTGVLAAKGSRILFMDADGSTPIEEIERLEKALNSGASVAIGSRALESAETKIEANLHRKIMGRVFNFFVNRFLLPGVSDTQCGFKMYEAAEAKFLFGLQTTKRFGFDYENLFLARRAGMRVDEVAVNWTNVAGSKVNLVADSARMFAGIFLIALRHRGIGPADYQEFLANEAGASTAAI